MPSRSGPGSRSTPLPTPWSTRLKAAILALPFVGTLVDIGGMWLTRFVWPPLAVLVIVGGSLFALGYALIAAISLHQLWVRKEGSA